MVEGRLNDGLDEFIRSNVSNDKPLSREMAEHYAADELGVSVEDYPAIVRVASWPYPHPNAVGPEGETLETLDNLARCAEKCVGDDQTRLHHFVAHDAPRLFREILRLRASAEGGAQP